MLLSSDTDTSPGEKEDIELLERALEKALRIRTGTGVSKKDHDRNKKSAPQKEPATTVVEFKEGMQASASKANQTTKRSTSKSAGIDKKEHKKPGASVSSMLGPKSAAGYHSEQSKTIINRNISGKAAAFSTPSLNNTVPVSHSEVSGVHSVPRKNGYVFTQLGLEDNHTLVSQHLFSVLLYSILFALLHGRVASDQTAKWKSLRSKQNRWLIIL